MKYLFLILLLFLTFFNASPVHAQPLPSIFYCVGDNPKPPCVTRTPSPSQSPITSEPSVSPSTEVTNPVTSTNPSPSVVVSTIPSTSPSTSPCTTQDSAVSTKSTGEVQALHHHKSKHHASKKRGFLQQFFQFLLQLLQLIFKQLGINLPVPTGPCPTPSPSATPTGAPSNSPSSGVSPSVAPSGTTTAPSPSSPAGGNPTPTIFGVSPTQAAATPVPTTGGGTQKTNCTPAKNATLSNTVSSKCGFPDTTNTGSTGSLTSNPSGPSANTGSGWTKSGGDYIVNGGGTLQNVSINGEVILRGSGAAVKNCKIVNGDSGGFGVRIEHTSNATVQNCTISGTNATSGRLLAGIKDIYGDSSNTKILKNNIYYMSTGVQIDEGLVQDNYIHDLGFLSGDHLNGTTSNGGTASLTLQHNTVFNSFDQTDAISLFEDFGSQKNRVIDDNLVAGGGYCMYGGQNSGGPAAANIKITNNHFSKMYFTQCGGQGGGIIAAWPPNGGGGVWSGNVWDETGASVGQ